MQRYKKVSWGENRGHPSIMGARVASCVCQIFLVYRTRRLLSLSLKKKTPTQSEPEPQSPERFLLTFPIAQGRNIHKLVAHMCQVKVIKRLAQTENYP